MSGHAIGEGRMCSCGRGLADHHVDQDMYCCEYCWIELVCEDDPKDRRERWDVLNRNRALKVMAKRRDNGRCPICNAPSVDSLCDSCKELAEVVVAVDSLDTVHKGNLDLLLDVRRLYLDLRREKQSAYCVQEEGSLCHGCGDCERKVV